MPTPRTLALALVLLALPVAGLVGAVPVVEDGSADPRLAGYPAGSYVTEEGYVAVPLRLDTPAWYTEEMARKVSAAGDQGLAYDVENDVPVRLATQFLFIRPGAWMWAPSGCTMNFIYGTPGSYQIGSAGHCNAVNQEVTLVVYPGVLAKIGKTAVSHNNGIGDDYSLVNIYAQWQQYVDANVALIGGPQGTFTGTANLNSPLVGKHIGHGLAIGTGGTPRVGTVTSAWSGASHWYCQCAVIFGDSGSAILVETTDAPLGKALGVITHLVVGPYTSAGTRATVIPAVVRSGDVNPLPPA